MELKLEHIQEITEVAVKLNKGEISILDDRRDFYYPLMIEGEVSPVYSENKANSGFTLLVKFEKDKNNNWKLKEIRK